MWPNVALRWDQFDEQQRAQTEQTFERTLEELADLVAAAIPRTLQMVDQARGLIDAIL